MSDQLADIIRTRLLGVRPDDQDVVLEDGDWLAILAAISWSSHLETTLRAVRKAICEGDVQHFIDAALSRPVFDEEDCPGHVASEAGSKVCARCGVHIDSLRPDETAPPVERD